MTASLHLDADLTLEVDTGVAEDDPGRHLAARLTGSGSTVTLTVDGLGQVPLGVSARRAARPLRDLARMLADDGLTVVVATRQGPLLSLGRVRQRVGDRAITRSPHIAVHDRRAALRLLRPRGTDGAPALTGLLPPGTPWPLMPTFTPPRRRHVTTTHDPLGGGDPRLVLYLTPPEHGGERLVLPLRRGVTTVGASPDDDLTVAGLQPGHVRVRRDAATDEYEVVPVHGAPTTVSGVAVTAPAPLRTGAPVRAGELTLVYVRDEYADHGLPYGGREGGEFSDHRPQRRRRYAR